jgi:hypothetical protein
MTCSKDDTPICNQLLRLTGIPIDVLRGRMAPHRVQLDDERHFGQPKVYLATSSGGKRDCLMKLYDEPGSGRQQRCDLELQPGAAVSPAIGATISCGPVNNPRGPQMRAVALPFAEIVASRTETIRTAARHLDVAAELACDVGP